MSSEVQIAVIDQQDTQIVLAVPGVQGATGSEIAAGGTANQVLRKASSTDYDTDWSLVTSAMIEDGAIVNADVNASAAIAGTKISPNFGSQNVVTTGTSTAASFIPTSSSVPTNGVYLPSANNVAISTNGTQRVLIEADGDININSGSFFFDNGFNRLGVGTATPDYELEVTSTGEADIQIDSANTYDAALRFAENGTNAFTIYHDASASALAIYDNTNTTERLRITSDGKLGLGTSSPQALLHLSGNNNANTGTDVDNMVLRFEDTDTTCVNQMLGSIEWYGNDTTLYPAGVRALIQCYGVSSQQYPNLRYKSRSHTFFVGNSGNVESQTTEALHIDALGNVGIGTTSPSGILSVNEASTSAGDSYEILHLGTAAGGTFQIGVDDKTAANPRWRINTGTNEELIYAQGGVNERLRIDNSGRLLVGTSSSYGQGSPLQVIGDQPIQIHRGVNGVQACILNISKSRNTTYGSYTIVQDGDGIGAISFRADDGTDYATTAAQISAEVDGTPGANDMPGRLVFSTTADGASSPTERMRIKSNGVTCIGTSTEGSISGDAVVAIGPNVAIISRSAIAAASTGTVDITVAGANGYQGFLIVANTRNGSANVRTQSTYSVFGRGTDSSIQQIATDNGSSNSAPFTVTTPSNGVIRVTNTLEFETTVNIQFFGGTSS